MSVLEDLYNYNLNLKKNISIDSYNSILNKAPFFEEEKDGEFSLFHKLIDAGYLNFISIDFKYNNSCTYKLRFTDKGIQSLKAINYLKDKKAISYKH